VRGRLEFLTQRFPLARCVLAFPLAFALQLHAAPVLLLARAFRLLACTLRLLDRRWRLLGPGRNGPHFRAPVQHEAQSQGRNRSSRNLHHAL
jgi:hypothetical protein